MDHIHHVNPSFPPFLLKGPILSLKKLRYDQEPKSDIPLKSILPVKPWNSIGNRRCRTPTLSGGAPFFIMCLCLQLRKDVSCSLISLSIPRRQKLLVKKYIFSLPAKAQFGLAIKIYSFGYL